MLRIPGNEPVVIAEVDGRVVRVQRGADNPLEVALRTYLTTTDQPDHARVLSHRLDGWSSCHVCYDVCAEVDRPGGPPMHRYYAITFLA